MSNPFSNYDPDAALPSAEPSDAVKLNRKNDWFTIKVTEVGALIEKEWEVKGGKNYFTTSFPINGELVAGELHDGVDRSTGEPVPNATVGAERVVYWFGDSKDGKLTRDGRLLQQALRNEGVTSLVAGDLFSGKLVDIKEPKQKGWQGERVRGFVVKAVGNRDATNDDPWGE